MNSTRGPIESNNSIESVICTRAVLGLCILAGSFFSGCVQTKTSEPSRTAVEQLLLSQAADEALDKADFSSLNGRRVFLDTTFFESIDKAYVVGSIRDKISSEGGMLVDTADEAQIIVEPRIGALSIDSGRSLVGIPSLPIPIPFVGAVTSPELSLYTADRQYSVAKIALLGYDAETRKHSFSTGPLEGQSHHHFYRILGFFNWKSTDIQEESRPLLQ